jgi:hypothetical protein
MAFGQPWSGDDTRHNEACHHRWQMRRNRSTADAEYRDDWYAQQCGGCRYWVALRGAIGLDYGLCTHAVSGYDGQVRFEHDGCDAFLERDDHTFG